MKSALRGHISTLDIHHLVAHGTVVDQFTEHHELGLFTHKEYLNAFREAGFTVEHDPVGLTGRGLYIGSNPSWNLWPLMDELCRKKEEPMSSQSPAVVHPLMILVALIGLAVMTLSGPPIQIVGIVIFVSGSLAPFVSGWKRIPPRH
jgi:hypothetical protein